MERNPIYSSILVAFDGSNGSTKALRRALLLAKDYNSRVTVFSVDEHVPGYAPGVGKIEEEPALRETYFAHLREQATSIAKEIGVDIEIETAVDHAAQAIIQLASKHLFDAIVIGHSGHSGVWGQLLGSTTARVVDHAYCDVIVVR